MGRISMLPRRAVGILEATWIAVLLSFSQRPFRSGRHSSGQSLEQRGPALLMPSHDGSAGEALMGQYDFG